MYVEPEFRGQGINTLVLDYLKDWSKTKKVSYFSLDVYADNEVAIKSYEKVGFKSSLLEMTMSLD